MISQPCHKRWLHLFRALVQSQMWLCLVTLLLCSVPTLARLFLSFHSKLGIPIDPHSDFKKSFSQMSELGGGGEMSQTFCVIIKQNIKMHFFSITPSPHKSEQVNSLLIGVFPSSSSSSHSSGMTSAGLRRAPLHKDIWSLTCEGPLGSVLRGL